MFADARDFHAEPSFLVGAFKSRIETALNEQLDTPLPTVARLPKQAGSR